MADFRLLFLIGAGGALGAVGRYAVSGWMAQLLGAKFPFGTLIVNIVGCLLLGVLMHLGTATATLSDEMRTVLRIGVLGAFTTYSTFGYETFRYLEDGDLVRASGNVAANLLFGLLAVWGGITLARLWVGGA